MATKKLNIDDNLIRLGILCLSIVILYQFTITTLRLNQVPVHNFQDSIVRSAYNIFYKPNTHPEITIVAIDDKSLREVALKWPWRRSVFADMIDKLLVEDPKAISLDISFIGKSSHGIEDDARLISSLKKSDKIVLASFIGSDGKEVRPPKEISDVAKVGFVNKYGNVMRYADTATLKDGLIDYSFELKTFSIYKDISTSAFKIKGRDLIAADRRIHFSRSSIFPIKFIYKENNFNVISVSDILKGEFDSNLIKNKLVMVGAFSIAIHDVHDTPLGSMPGILINANALSSIIDNNIPYKAPGAILFFIFLFSSLLSAFIGYKNKISLSFLYIGLFFIVSYLVAMIAFKFNVLIDIFGLLSIIVASFSLSRLYLTTKKYVDKSHMVNLLTIDKATGIGNIYFLIMKLSHLIKNAKNKQDMPSLIFVSIDITGADRANLTQELENKILATVINNLNEIIHSNSGSVIARASEMQFGIILSTSDTDRIKDLSEAVYKNIKNLEIILPDSQQKKNLTVTLGGVCGSSVGEPSARLLIYIAEQAVDKASAILDDKIFITGLEGENVVPIVAESQDRFGEDAIMDIVIDELKEKNSKLKQELGSLGTRLDELKGAYITVISSLVKALEEKDMYTAGHSERVAGYSLMLADSIGMKKEEMQILKYASLLHDLGKIGIPDKILNKKGELTSEEREIINKHEIESVRILEPVKFFKECLPLILHHHERFDGKGYPHGLSAERIPLGARIIAIADTFDAMTSGRSYNQPLKTDQAVAVLKENAGTQFDPNLVEKFAQALAKE